MMGALTGDVPDEEIGVRRVKVGKERIAELTVGQDGRGNYSEGRTTDRRKGIFWLGQGW